MVDLETVKKARSFYEEHGWPCQRIAKSLAVSGRVVRGWADDGKWKKPANNPVDPPKDPDAPLSTRTLFTDLDVLERLSSQVTDAQLLAVNDRKLKRQFMLLPEILGKLSPMQWIDKADKIAKLVDKYREVLGFSDAGKGSRTMVSVGVVSGGAMPTQVAIGVKHIQNNELQALDV